MLSNVSEFCCRTIHADPEREPPAECCGARSLPGQQQFLVREPHLPIQLTFNQGNDLADSNKERFNLPGVTGCSPFRQTYCAPLRWTKESPGWKAQDE
jgi:hypothetical protein